MMDELARRILAALLLFVSCTAFAQEADTKTAPNSTTMVLESDSRDTRQQFQELLRRLPPDVGKVLKLDPSLWANDKYLANYPALAAFVAAHPDVAHSPNFYLESVWIPSDPSPETPTFRIWNRMLETISIFGAFLFVAFVLTWLIRTLIEQRRWTRLSKTQADVHNKLLDRFASNEELLNYIQTPAGRRFLESAPIPLDQPSTRPVSAPIGRRRYRFALREHERPARRRRAAGGAGLPRDRHRHRTGRLRRRLVPPLAPAGLVARPPFDRHYRP